jgi:type IV pilus assembly protein PilC
MPVYRYRALAASRRIAKGEMDAPNEAALARALADLGVELIEAKARRAAAGQRAPRPATARLPLPLFCRQMEDLLRAGLPLTDGLRLIVASLPDGAFRDTLTTTHRALTEGAGIADSFAVTNDFPAFFVAALRAAEGTGDLATCFGHLARELDWQAEMRRKLTKALRYPLFLILVACGVTGFMMSLVVPQIVTFLQDLDIALPFSTRLLIAMAKGATFAAFALLILVPLVAASVWIGRRHSPAVARVTDGLLLRVPLVGPLLALKAEARLVRTLTTLLASGLTLPESLALALQGVTNCAWRARVAAGQTRLLSGAPFSQAAAFFLSPFVVQTLAVGEASGRLRATLNDVERHHDRMIDAATSRLIGAIEPTLTLLVGGLLAWIVLAVLGPLYGSLAQIGGGA